MVSSTLLLLSLATNALAGTFRKTLELTWADGSPDGFTRKQIFINGQFPAPWLEIPQGDNVELTFVNHLPTNTTIHFHGIDQRDTPWADGVPGLSQRPIQPGATYVYKWKASQHGSYFYHAHARGQIDDGAYGPLTIKPKPTVAKPFSQISSSEVALLEAAVASVKPIILSDWRHMTSERTFELQQEAGVESSLCMDSLLVNGKGSVNCWTRDDLQTYTPAQVKPLLTALNLNVTNKGCLPPAAMDFIQGGGANLSVIPPEVFEICTPTQAAPACIQAPAKKWVAFDLISSTGMGSLGVSIDQHPFWVYAADGQYIEPVKVDAIDIFNGERYSVLVQLNQTPGRYAIRVASTDPAQLINTVAVLTYSGKSCTVGTLSSTPSINIAGGIIKPGGVYLDSTTIRPFPRQYPQTAPTISQTAILKLGNVGGKLYQWSLNGTMYDHHVDDSAPPLLYRDPSTISANAFTLSTQNGTWVDVIMKVEQAPQPGHPIHKHSNKAFQIGRGTGNFTWNSVAEAAAAHPEFFNFENPPLRDTFVTLPARPNPTWLVIRYHVENPGAFLLHCHISAHVEGGMSLIMLDGVDEWPEVPAGVRN